MKFSETRRPDWRLLAGFWVLVAAVFVIRGQFSQSPQPLFADTDDAMRLVVVRDLLGGQGWFDHVQHRLNTPWGAEIHWSRLVDLPIAALILLFRPFFGSFGETIAAYAWPLALLLGLLLISARLAMRLAGKEAILPGFILPAFSILIMAEFAPGRLDHHNVQIILSMLVVWFTVEAWQRPGFAIASGIAVATGLAVGTESLPFAAASIASVGLFWVADPSRRVQLRGFGAALAIATVLHLMLALPPSRWLEPMCDALSGTYALVATVTGLSFVLLTALPLKGAHWGVRLAFGALAAAAVVAAVGIQAPVCLGGPYAALDPWLRENWLAHVQEAEPLWAQFAGQPGFAISISFPPFLALAVVGWRILRGSRENRAEWLVFALFLVFAVLIMLIQVRGARLAAALAVPAGAWAIVAARQHYLAHGRIRDAAGLVGAWLAFSGIVIALIMTLVLMPFTNTAAAEAMQASRSNRSACVLREAYAGLAALPEQRVMTPIDMGAHVLLYTGHSVVAAPYHRNPEGIRDALAVYRGPVADAREILAERGVTLLAYCQGLPELDMRENDLPDVLVRRIPADDIPGWLEEISAPEARLRLFRVVPAL